MRLIDADALRQKMYHEAFETDTDMQRWDGGCWIRYKLFENAIEQTPVADVRENKHGEWVFERNYVDEDSDEFVDCYVCSLCGAPHNEEYPFCPDCGAIMNGGDDE